ncbi:MAG: transporter substrate-binding domain-containing protein [Candidatus Puniceispirillaceae bacterium]
MKKILLTAVLAVFTASGALAETVRLGTEGAYEPWNFVNDSGKLDGFEIELGNELCKRASLSCEWVKNDWDSIIPNLKSGNYDAIIAGIDFTEEYYPADPSSYVGLAGAGEAVTKGVVAAQTATIHAGYVASSNATLVEFATAEETIAAVRNGEADAVLADSGYLKPIVDESNGELVFVGNQIQIGGGVGMGVRKSDGALRAKLNAAIASVKSDGTLNKMIAKWFGADAPQF